jgi:hypothetical protein
VTTVSNVELFGRPVFETWRDMWFLGDPDMATKLACTGLLAKRREGSSVRSAKPTSSGEPGQRLLWLAPARYMTRT